MGYDIVYKAICILIVIGGAYVGVRYANLGFGPNKHHKLANKQNTVKKSRQIFGISDAEDTEMKDVNIVKYEDLGINS